MNRRAAPRRRRILAALTALASGVGISTSCTTPTTELVAGMTTQIQVDKDLAAVGVVIRYGGELVSCKAYLLSDGTVTLPSTLGMTPQEGREGEVLEPVTIQLLGFRTAAQGQAFDDTCVAAIPAADSPEVVVIRSRRAPYTEEQILYLPMPLRESCSGVVCADGETCIGGVCEDEAVDPATLQIYRDSFVFGNTNTCFNASLCLPGGVTQPAILTDASTCTFTYPVPPGATPPPTTPGNLNVEIVYQTLGTEILDLDEKEGFVFPDENDPLTFRLAENLCVSNHQKGKIIAVSAAPVCPAKRALQPICDEDMEDILAGGHSPQSSLSLGLCTIGQPLVPSESALYVLLDRSLAMTDLYGPEGLEFAINVPLQNPIAARTLLALSFLPADAASCTDGSFQTPDFGFGDVDVVRQPIATALGDPSTVLGSDPQVFLDGGMVGAYALLATQQPTSMGRFNRRALIVVGNRDLQSHCAPSLGDAATLAADARASDGIFTYVAVLDAPAGAPQFGDDPQASAAAIATAGGTTAFDAIVNDEDGLLAVQKVLNDLGSCVYDPPPTLISGNATHLSYVNPATLAREDIPRNDACTSEAAADTVDGWGLEADGAVRICGAPCAALRTTLTDAAAFYGALGQPAPAIPIIATLPCDDPSRFQLPPP